MFVDAGAAVVVGDTRPERAVALADAVPGVIVVDAAAVPELDCDVLAPCALGGVLSHERVARLRCRVVCGAANNQLASDDVEDALVARGILYVPDFVANAGGIVNIAEEFTGYSRERALARTASIFDTVGRVFATAEERGITPGRAAVLLACERIEREGAGRRWQPGDPAAWTSGEPLRYLRPPR
jgi:leucine dehydrogenase